MTDKLRPFVSHGVVFRKAAANAKDVFAICPFCNSVFDGEQKEGKFSVERETGRFQCWHCKRGGNIVTFLEQLYAFWLEQTNGAEYTELAESRPGLTADVLRSHKLALNVTTGKWLLPSYDRRAKLSNLYTWESGSHAYATGGLPQASMFGMETFQPGRPIIIVEGPWSRMAVLRLAAAAKIKVTVLGVPGNVFKSDWCDLFVGQEVYLAFDNDTAGDNECQNIIDHIAGHGNGKPKSLKKLSWPASAARSWDPRNLIHYELDEAKHKAPAVWKDFLRLFTPISAPDVTDPNVDVEEHEEPLPKIKSFNILIKRFAEAPMHLNQNMRDGIAVMLAVAISSQLQGSPLWAFIVGAPGCLSGDTTVGINRAGKGFQTTLKELHRRFHGGKSSRGKTWRKDIPTQIQYRHQDGSVRLTPILDVVDSGEKEVFEVTTLSGKKIVATKDHRFLTEHGWKPLSKLSPGSTIYTAVPAGTGSKSKPYYSYIGNLKGHPYAIKKDIDRWPFQVARHRLVMEASLNSLPLDQYLDRLRTSDTDGLFFIPPHMIVHHKDEDTFNNGVNNLELMTEESHRRHHSKTHFKNVLARAVEDEVIDIQPLGKTHTYDVCCGEPHNFIGNGFVVHNSGKTMTLEAFSRYARAVYRSSIRATELISGWMTDDGKDPSLIPRLQGKVLVLKDYTEVMSMNQADQEILYGVLRGAYDGRAERFFANGVERVFNHCWFNMLAGVTDDIKAHNRASLGERFFRFQWVEPQTHDRSAHIRAAIRGLAHQVERERYLAGVVAGFLNNFDLERIKMPKIELWFENRLTALVQILSHLRARINTERHGELTHRPTIEIGTRPGVQLTKLAQCLAIIFGKSKIDQTVYSIVEKVVWDTCEGWNLDIFQVLVKHMPKPVTKELIEQEGGIPSTTCFRRLEAMMALGTVVRAKIPSMIRGRPAYGWALSPDLIEHVKQAKVTLK